MKYFFDIITERRASSALMRGTLTSLSYLFRAGVGLRHFAYAKEWISKTQLNVPVISVGNIVLGGTGKTPFVQMLTRALQDFYKTAILSRGFRSQIERSGKVLKISSQGQPLYPAEECGDEPFCLAQETMADIWVGCDRVECGHRAIQDGAQCLILDDGMQHRQLARDIEIVVVDAKDPFSKGRFFPRGLLRDFPSRLKEAHLIVANHIADPAHFTSLQRELKKYTPAPLLGVHVEFTEKERIRHKRAGVYCGIGRPERFIDALRALEVDIVDTLVLLDHRKPEEGQLRRFVDVCQKKGADLILCTMKDYVKLPLKFCCALPLFPVKMKLQISSGKEHWDTLIKNIADRIKNNN